MIKECRINNNDTSNLKQLGFWHIGDGVYTYKFPVYKYNGYATLWGQFVAFSDSDNIYIDLLQEDNNLYAPFYSDNEDNDVLKICISNIKKEMEKLGIYNYMPAKKRTRSTHKATYIVKGNGYGRKEVSC